MDYISSLSNKLFEVYELQWDTDYFGIPSAKVILKGNIGEDGQKLLKDYLNRFKFVTIINTNNNPYNNFWLGKEKTVFLTDINMQFIKYIEGKNVNVAQLAEIYQAYEGHENIINIAKKSFHYSRFFNDPYLKEEKARNIYAYWVECAFNKEDKYFAVVKKDSKIIGFVLFSIDSSDQSAVVELIAVEEFYQGLKVGKTLLQSVENFVHNRGIVRMKVGTQVNNVSAVRFYTSNGFKYVNCNAVYHYWPHK